MVGTMARWGAVAAMGAARSGASAVIENASVCGSAPPPQSTSYVRLACAHIAHCLELHFVVRPRSC
eukprot:138237-Prymnesium_polylepis.1